VSRLDVVLVGPPGAGKGTQASRLAAREALTHLSTGDLLRQAIAAGSELGQRVKGLVEAGRLVPDEVVLSLVEQRLGDSNPSGVLLDGFPRTIRQAEMLADMFHVRGLAPPIVIELVVPDDEVVNRLSCRRICSSCGPRPAMEAACGSCGNPVVVRTDDRESVVRERLTVYAKQTAPLSEWYRARGDLHAVDGLGSPELIAGRIAAAVDRVRARREGNR
jgi:adenylate kinase